MFPEYLLLVTMIELNLNSGSAQVIILLAVCQRFALVRFFDNGPYGNKAECLSLVNHTGFYPSASLQPINGSKNSS